MNIADTLEQGFNRGLDLGTNIGERILNVKSHFGRYSEKPESRIRYVAATGALQNPVSGSQGFGDTKSLLIIGGSLLLVILAMKK